MAEIRTPPVDPSLRAFHRISSLHDRNIMVDGKDAFSVTNTHIAAPSRGHGHGHQRTGSSGHGQYGVGIADEISFLSRQRGSSHPEALPGIVNYASSH